MCQRTCVHVGVYSMFSVCVCVYVWGGVGTGMDTKVPLRFGSGVHGCSLQACSSCGQSGSPHTRALNLMPPPQDLVHALHCDHCPRSGLAAMEQAYRQTMNTAKAKITDLRSEVQGTLELQNSIWIPSPGQLMPF